LKIFYERLFLDDFLGKAIFSFDCSIAEVGQQDYCTVGKVGRYDYCTAGEVGQQDYGRQRASLFI